MKNKGMFALLISAMSIGVACNNSGDSVKEANDSNSVKMDSNKTDATSNKADTSRAGTAAITNSVSEKDSKFMTAAANGGMMEVTLGNLAEQNAMNQRVKDFGKMMVDDHSKANDEMKALAARKNVSLPQALGNDEQKHVDHLSKKMGKDFDKEYVDMMVSDHKKDIKEFEDAQKNCNDPDLKDFVSKTLPTLRKHLDSVQAIQAALKGKK